MRRGEREAGRRVREHGARKKRRKKSGFEGTNMYAYVKYGEEKTRVDALVSYVPFGPISKRIDAPFAPGMV